ncbi:hypothetical protein CAEBREN_14567 [Caenorhabditis brenneri]|uniref:Uncharacterized protein n=1 Tax=Caenorhabditis brenneri TaxID=135651 RepID=G0MKQ4_CAEBE|nr:hypothetical protein CAEBREN_14567 [Caenorhabditis brenneri]
MTLFSFCRESSNFSKQEICKNGSAKHFAIHSANIMLLWTIKQIKMS